MKSERPFIPVHISPFFWLLAGAIGWLNSATIMGTLIWMGAITFSVLAHEYGHALTARYFGHEAQIQLVGLGGVTQRQGPPLKTWQELLIVINGPLAGFILFCSAYFILPFTLSLPLLVSAVSVIAYINLFWTGFNLLPLYPLDGGQLMRIGFQALFGIKGLRFSLASSFILATLLSAGAFVFHQIFIGILFVFLAFESYKSWREAYSLSDIDRDEELQRELVMASKYHLSGKDEMAWPLLDAVRNKAVKGLLFQQATIMMANILVQRGSIAEAYDLLNPLRSELNALSLELLQQLACRLEKWPDALVVGTKAFQEFNHSSVVVTNALCCAQMKEYKAALGWLECAQREGVEDLDMVMGDKAFDPLRSLPGFQQLSAR